MKRTRCVYATHIVCVAYMVCVCVDHDIFLQHALVIHAQQCPGNQYSDY